MARGFLVWSGNESGNASFAANGSGGFLAGYLGCVLYLWVLGGGGGGSWVWIGNNFVEALVLKTLWLLLVKGFGTKE